MTQSGATIPRLLLDAAARHGDSMAVVESGTRTTYDGLLQRALRAGAVLAQAGVKAGDRVGILLPNSLSWIEAGLGAAFLGAVVVPVSTRLKGDEAAYILNKARVHTLIAVGNFLGTDYGAMLDRQDLPALRCRYRVGPGAEGWADWDAATQAIAPAGLAAIAEGGRSVRPDDLAEVIFTSGTTGFPKGAMIRHGQIVGAYSFYADRAAIRQGDRYLIIAPMFHSFGWKAGVIASIARGATMYPLQAFDAGRVLALIDAEKITAMGGPPTIFSSLLDANRQAGRDMSSLRSVVTGASMVSPALITALLRDVGVERVVNAYGLTEASALVTMTRPDDDVDRVATTAGVVIDGVELRCVDPAGVPVPAGEAGEIEVRGYTVMAGYFDDPAATADTITADGWLRTGDVGVLDQDGYLRVTDRMKDMFITGGFNCYPAEIERLMLAHPDIREVAVIGMPDARLGEVARAIVVPADGRRIEPEALIAWCRGQMANYKVPRVVEVVDALPRNAMGKVQKFVLRANGR